MVAPSMCFALLRGTERSPYLRTEAAFRWDLHAGGLRPLPHICGGRLRLRHPSRLGQRRCEVECARRLPLVDEGRAEEAIRPLLSQQARFAEHDRDIWKADLGLGEPGNDRERPNSVEAEHR